METLAFHFLDVIGSIIPKTVVMFFERGTKLVAHLIPKVTQRPKKSYKYHQIEQDAHSSFCFQVNEPCDCCKLKIQAHKEFDDGIAKAELLS